MLWKFFFIIFTPKKGFIYFFSSLKFLSGYLRIKAAFFPSPPPSFVCEDIAMGKKNYALFSIYRKFSIWRRLGGGRTFLGHIRCKSFFGIRTVCPLSLPPLPLPVHFLFALSKMYIFKRLKPGERNIRQSSPLLLFFFIIPKVWCY